MPEIEPSYDDLKADRNRWRHEHRITSQREKEWRGRARRAEAEVERLLGLAQQALDALDAEREPDYGRGHDKAVRALLAIFGKRPAEIGGELTPLDQLPPNDELRVNAS